MTIHRLVVSSSIGFLASLFTGAALADSRSCAALPNWSTLQNALTSSITAASGSNGGLGFNMWGTLVANDGTVCAVAFSGKSYTNQWLGSNGAVLHVRRAENGTPSTHPVQGDELRALRRLQREIPSWRD
jgi:hypothetical protein